jgi:hypothetical protein
MKSMFAFILLLSSSAWAEVIQVRSGEVIELRSVDCQSSEYSSVKILSEDIYPPKSLVSVSCAPKICEWYRQGLSFVIRLTPDEERIFKGSKDETKKALVKFIQNGTCKSSRYILPGM